MRVRITIGGVTHTGRLAVQQLHDGYSAVLKFPVYRDKTAAFQQLHELEANARASTIMVLSSGEPETVSAIPAQLNFQVGQRVRVRRSTGAAYPQAGALGTVVWVVADDRVDVNFDESFAEGHACNGRTHYGHGRCYYNMNAADSAVISNLEVVAQE